MGTGVPQVCGPGRRHLVGFLLLLLCWPGRRCEAEKAETASGDSTARPAQDGPQAFPEQQEANLPVFTMDYPRIQVPFEFTLWVLLASFAKIGMSDSTATKVFHSLYLRKSVDT